MKEKNVKKNDPKIKFSESDIQKKLYGQVRIKNQKK